MPKENVSMRRIRDVLRLCWGCGLSERAAATSCSLARSTVAAPVTVAALPSEWVADLSGICTGRDAPRARTIMPGTAERDTVMS